MKYIDLDYDVLLDAKGNAEYLYEDLMKIWKPGAGIESLKRIMFVFLENSSWDIYECWQVIDLIKYRIESGESIYGRFDDLFSDDVEAVLDEVLEAHKDTHVNDSDDEYFSYEQYTLLSDMYKWLIEIIGLKNPNNQWWNFYKKLDFSCKKQIVICILNELSLSNREAVMYEMKKMKYWINRFASKEITKHSFEERSLGMAVCFYFACVEAGIGEP